MTSESWKEFKQIIQGKKLEKQKRKKDWWHATPRFFSKYITWILVKTPITANAITIFGIIISLIGLLLIGFGNHFFIILGFVLLYIYYISDECDGEVARYKKATSLRGIYYDEISHLLFLSFFFVSLGFFIYRINGDLLYVFLGVFGSFFLQGIRIIRKIAVVTLPKSDMKRIVNKETEELEINSPKKSFAKLMKTISINLVNGFSHYIVITTVFLICIVLYFLYDYLTILELIMIIYVIFMSVVFISFMIIKSRSIEWDIINIYKSIIERN